MPHRAGSGRQRVALLHPSVAQGKWEGTHLIAQWDEALAVIARGRKPGPEAVCLALRLLGKGLWVEVR